MPETPRELTIPEIHTLVEQFGDCAKRAKAAGFDAVEVHGAHGYLAGAFASPFSNKRSDEYGGTIRNRARFGMEIIRNIKEKCGEDYPVLYRISYLILQFYTDQIEQKTGEKISEHLRFLLEMYCQGSIYMTVQRVLGKLKGTPEEIARSLVDAMPLKLMEVFKVLNLL